MANKFKNKQDGDNNLTPVRKTLPMPTTCDSCGFELPKDAERNLNYFVNFMICRDMNRNNKTITGVPSQFLKRIKKDGNDIIAGSSAEGYHLKENFTFVRWVVWCIKCHSRSSRLQDMSRKTNNMKPTGSNPSLSLEESLKRLHRHQNMKSEMGIL